MTDCVGSDYPYASSDKILTLNQILDDFSLYQHLRNKIYFKNAEGLFAKAGQNGFGWEL
jgi:hypothetical protein